MTERDQLIQAMNQMQIDYERCRERVIELNGSIKATESILNDIESKGNADDTESKTASGSDSN